MKNKMIDLNNHLFEQLEKLNDDELTGEALETEIKRAKAMTEIAGNIIDNAKVQLDATKLMAEYCRTFDVKQIPQTLLNDNN